MIQRVLKQQLRLKSSVLSLHVQISVFEEVDAVMVSSSLPVPASFLTVNANHSHLSSPLLIQVYSAYLLPDGANFLEVHSPALKGNSGIFKPGPYLVCL